MSSAILSALGLLTALLLEQACMSALPYPWRSIPLLLVIALVIMHRASLELGVSAFMVGTIFMVVSGMAGAETLLTASLTMGGAVFFSTRIFARRSLAAFFGFALGTSFLYEALHSASLAIRMADVSLLAEIFLIGVASALALLLSLVVETMVRNFGLRFVRKETTYEVRQTS
ncbi:MAG: hypothetical protein WC802_00770 [Patescibacteria group bacterium]|jgi:hypothetical protein